MVICWAIIIGVSIMGIIGYGLVASARPRPRRRSTTYDRAVRDYREARYQVADVFAEARIAMEEAAGRRRPRERRLEDGLRGSWRDW
jgi:hypothetical protein